jgi:hypothetical protein
MRDFGESSGSGFHRTGHLQQGGYCTYVCSSVCSGGVSCQGTLCEFQRRDELEVKIPDTRKRGFHHKCPARVVFSCKNTDRVWRVSEVCSIFDHHVDCRVFTTRSRVTAAQMRNLPTAQSLVRNHPDISTPSFVQTVMDTVGASCHQSKRHMRRTLKCMKQPRSLMDPLQSPEYDYHFFHSLCRRFVQKNPGSWAQVLTKTEDDEERFDGFLYCLKPQVQRIVTSGYKTFAADAAFIKPEHNGLDGWALCNLSSRDPNGNLVCLASCLCPKENADAYNKMFDKVMDIEVTPQQDSAQPRTFREVLDSPDSLILSDRGKGEYVTTRWRTHSLCFGCVVHHDNCVCWN